MRISTKQQLALLGVFAFITGVFLYAVVSA